MLAVAVTLLVLVVSSFLAAIGGGSWSVAGVWLGRAVSLCVGFAALASWQKSLEDRTALRVLRRKLPALGVGYQQLLAAQSWIKDPKPTNLAKQLGLELYLTVALAARHAQDR